MGPETAAQMKALRHRLAGLWLPIWQQRVQVLLATAALLAVLKVSGLPAFLLDRTPLDVDWWQWLDPIISVATPAGWNPLSCTVSHS